MATKSSLSKRWLYLVVGVFSMLFSGVLYAWSILKIPFKEIFEWSDSSLAFNFTLTMCFFCLGAFAGSLICKRIGPQITLIIAGVLVGIGFVMTSFLNADMQFLLYISYAILAGTGIGISYNVIVSTVCAWFPDRKGFCSGCLMMGFGISTLLMGNVISAMFENPNVGWSKTYLMMGIVVAVVLIIAGIILRRPTPDIKFPAGKEGKIVRKEAFEVRDFSTAEMLKSFTFWRAFVCMAFMTAVGNSVISFARDLVISVDAAPALATTLVGVLAVCNGLGRIITGAVYDLLGRRTTMISANILTIVAAGITLSAVMLHSLPLCIVGLCLTGLSYGSCPTVTSAFTASFYGPKYFSINYSIVNFNLILASFIATFSNSLLISSGSYTAPFVMLLILAVCALGLNFTIRKP
ncbi:MAG: MFS transporter [Acutalibacteraceae bacterium]|nr:MFS transporter [Acutalibacteraceae bacterium]